MKLYRSLRIRLSNLFFAFTLCLLVFLFFNGFEKDMTNQHSKQMVEKVLLHNNLVDSFYAKHKSLKTSNLGSKLFKNEDYSVFSKKSSNKTFLILIWKRWKHLQKRHLYYFGSTRHDPLAECSVNNCIFSGNDTDLKTADAVVVHLHTAEIPVTGDRNLNQKWIYLDDEAPKNSFNLAKKKPKMSELANIFNWSMTYRTNADIPVPYGRTIPLSSPIVGAKLIELIPNWKVKRRDVLAAILMSNCGVAYRNKLLKDVKKELAIHVHGDCGDEVLKGSCPGYFRADCDLMAQYLFYFVLENAKCKEYMTEKLFYNAYFKGAIPVIQGPSVEDCERLLPPNSYLHFDNYGAVKDLVKDIIEISKDEKRLLSYHAWRKSFEIRNEHGYFGSKSYHLCRLCEAMNYNDMKTSSYDEKDLKRFLNVEALCRD